MKPDMWEVVEKLTGRVPAVTFLWEFQALVERFLEREYRNVSEADRKDVAARIVDMYPVQKFMDDPCVEDIMINALNPIFVYDSRKGMIKTDERFESFEELEGFMRKLLLFSGKGELSRINDLHIPGGARANVVFSPFGPQITIRRFTQVPPSIIDLVEWGTLDYPVAAQLWLYAEGLGVKPANILIAGTPSSGKTTLLNSMFSFLPSGQRVVAIEDTLELNTKTEENCARLVTGDGVTMQDLVKNALRMRPDRIIIGEVRGGEARDFMTAMNVGKICMGTLHAGTPREAVMRLEREPMNVPTSMIPLIDVIVTMGRFVSSSAPIRRITDISEIAGVESGKVLLSERYVFDFKAKKLVEMSPSITYRDRLATAAGVSPKELMQELKRRETILRELKRRGLNAIEDLSLFCKTYYEDPEGVLKKLSIKV